MYVVLFYISLPLILELSRLFAPVKILRNSIIFYHSVLLIDTIFSGGLAALSARYVGNVSANCAFQRL